MREIDLTAIRARLAGDAGETWWRGLEELADTDEFRALLHREFPEGASELDDPRGRREFLKLMGASLALAGAAGCTRQPAEPQSELGARLVKEYKIDGPRRLTSCSTCHR